MSEREHEREHERGREHGHEREREREREQWLRQARQRRQERSVALAFLASAGGAVGFALVYALGGQTQWEGVTLGVAFGGLAAGLGIWGRRLLQVGGHVEPRVTPSRSHATAPPAARLQRRWLVRLLGLPLTAIGAAALLPLRSLIAPGAGTPARRLRTTAWTGASPAAGMRLVDAEGRPVRARDITSAAYVIVFPEGHESGSHADSAAFVVRLDPARLTVPPPGGQVDGVVAYSLICTHAGCPVTLYQQNKARMVCPCHQSVFDLLAGARPVGGPAGSALPGLPITQDADGFLRATGDFTGPPGPGFWSRP